MCLEDSGGRRGGYMMDLRGWWVQKIQASEGHSVEPGFHPKVRWRMLGYV